MWLKAKYIFSSIIFIKIFIILKFQKPLFTNVEKPKHCVISGDKIFRYWHNASRDLWLYVQPNTDTIIQKPVQKIEPVFLLVIVCSATGNFEARKAIRSTWGNKNNLSYKKYLEEKYGNDTGSNIGNTNSEIGNINMRILFLLGLPDGDKNIQKKILAENKKHGDIIQEDFIDSYGNLTIKVGMMLKWIWTNHNDNIEYILKADDDVYLNIHELVNELIYIYRQPIMLMGLLVTNQEPYSSRRSKYYSPKHMYDYKVFPDYLRGCSYLMTLEAALTLFETALNTPIHYLEDVFYTGICTVGAEIHLVHNEGFAKRSDPDINCKYLCDITICSMKPKQIIKAHKKSKRCRLLYKC